MRGTSSTSLGEVLQFADSALHAEIGSVEPIADQLFSMCDAIDSSNQLVRLLSDSGRPAAVREQALRSLFTDRVSPTALQIGLEIVTRRWTEQIDVLEAFELVGVAVLLGEADRQGSLEQVEEELFEVARVIDSSPELSKALRDRRRSGGQRGEVLAQVLGDRVLPLVAAIGRRATSSVTDRSPARRLVEFAEFASARRRRSLATVASARPLDEGQKARLAGILARIYGREVHMNCRVDPDVVGGLRIQVGDDLYDATVLARLARAREQLVS